MGKQMSREKAESYVFYYAEKYLSYTAVRQSVGIFLIITYFSLYFGLEESARPFCLTLLLLTLIYSVCVIIFLRKSDGVNSFRLRFLVSGSVGMFISLYFLVFAVMGFSLLKRNVLTGALIAAAVLCFVIAASTSVTVLSVRSGRYMRKIKQNPLRDILIILIAGAVFFAVIGGIPSRSDQPRAIRALYISCLVVSALSSLAGGNLLKYYWCKKYGINCDRSGRNESPALLRPEPQKKSLPKKILKGVGLAALTAFLAATLVGAYITS